MSSTRTDVMNDPARYIPRTILKHQMSGTDSKSRSHAYMVGKLNNVNRLTAMPRAE